MDVKIIFLKKEFEEYIYIYIYGMMLKDKKARVFDKISQRVFKDKCSNWFTMMEYICVFN